MIASEYSHLVSQLPLVYTEVIPRTLQDDERLFTAFTKELMEHCRVRVEWLFLRPVLKQKVGIGVVTTYERFGVIKTWLRGDSPILFAPGLRVWQMTEVCRFQSYGNILEIPLVTLSGEDTHA